MLTVAEVGFSLIGCAGTAHLVKRSLKLSSLTHYFYILPFGLVGSGLLTFPESVLAFPKAAFIVSIYFFLASLIVLATIRRAVRLGKLTDGEWVYRDWFPVLFFAVSLSMFLLIGSVTS